MLPPLTEERIFARLKTIGQTAYFEWNIDAGDSLVLPQDKGDIRITFSDGRPRSATMDWNGAAKPLSPPEKEELRAYIRKILSTIGKL